MKKIVLSRATSIINLYDTNLKYGNYYGAEYQGWKYFIQSYDYFYPDKNEENGEKTNWKLKSYRELTLNNNCDLVIQNVRLSLREYIESLIKNDIEVFVFEDFVELAKWLSQKD